MSRQALYSLKMLPVWVTPEHLVSTARFVLQGHRLVRLPVVGAEGVVGYVTGETLAAQTTDRPVGDLVETFTVVLDGATSIREAASRFVESGVDAAPVTYRGRFLGVVTAVDLLRELSQSWDPLTELPWLERLRDWSVNQLTQGNEITLICIDLDDFGLYNRRYGHSQGDLLLRRYSERFRSLLDQDLDLIVRIGGDEFIVGTIRPLAEAQELARELRESTQRVSLPDLLEPVAFTIGMAGGKRTQERENTHFEAMFDNLVKMAQADCQSRKMAKPTVVTSAVVAAGPERVQEYEVVSVTQQREPKPMTQVIVRAGSRIIGGVDSSDDLNLAVALATARALESWSPSLKFAIEDVSKFDDANGNRLVGITGTTILGGEQSRLAGSAKYDADLPRAIAEGVLDAFARANVAVDRL